MRTLRVSRCVRMRIGFVDSTLTVYLSVLVSDLDRDRFRMSS